jgi:four helix bundle protein
MADDLVGRTLNFAVRVVRLYASLDKSTEAHVIGKQMLRSGTSVGAHYREGIRARSKEEFIAKLGGALQELEETGYWLDLLQHAQIVPEQKLQGLRQEVNELTAILVTISKKTKAST